MQSESGAMTLRIAGFLQLGEAAEQSPLILRADADAAVFHRNADGGHGPVVARGERQTHVAAIGELHGIGEQVQDDLSHQSGIGTDAQFRLRHRYAEIEPLAFGVRAHRVDDVADDALAHHRFEMRFDLAGLDLRDIQQVVDEREQVSRARLDRGELFFLVSIERTGQLEHQRAGESDDGIERCAQFVRHVGQELALHAVGGLGTVLGVAQFLRAFRDIALEIRLGLAQRRLRGMSFGSIGHADDCKHRVAVLVVHEPAAEAEDPLPARGRASHPHRQVAQPVAAQYPAHGPRRHIGHRTIESRDFECVGEACQIAPGIGDVVEAVHGHRRLIHVQHLAVELGYHDPFGQVFDDRHLAGLAFPQRLVGPRQFRGALANLLLQLVAGAARIDQFQHPFERLRSYAREQQADRDAHPEECDHRRCARQAHHAEGVLQRNEEVPHDCCARRRGDHASPRAPPDPGAEEHRGKEQGPAIGSQMLPRQQLRPERAQRGQQGERNRSPDHSVAGSR